MQMEAPGRVRGMTRCSIIKQAAFDVLASVIAGREHKGLGV